MQCVELSSFSVLSEARSGSARAISHVSDPFCYPRVGGNGNDRTTELTQQLQPNSVATRRCGAADSRLVGDQGKMAAFRLATRDSKLVKWCSPNFSVATKAGMVQSLTEPWRPRGLMVDFRLRLVTTGEMVDLWRPTHDSELVHPAVQPGESGRLKRPQRRLMSTLVSQWKPKVALRSPAWGRLWPQVDGARR